MRPIYVTKQLDAADPDNIFESAQPNAGPLTLDGVAVVDGVAILDTQRRVLITSDADDSGNTFTITGTDDQGHVISETVTGPDGTPTTVSTTLDFKTVTEVEISGNAVGNILVGTNGVGATPPIPLDQYVPDFTVMLATILRSGAANWTVQFTFDDVFAAYAPQDVQAKGAPAGNPTTIVWWDHADITAKSADAKGSLVDPVKAVRLLINSGEGEVELQVIQGGTQ